MKTAHLKLIIITISVVSAFASFWQTFTDAHKEILAEARKDQQVTLALSFGDILIMRTLLTQTSFEQLTPEQEEQIGAIKNVLGTLKNFDIQKEGEGASIATEKIDSSVSVALMSAFQLTVLLPLIAAVLTGFADFRGFRETRHNG